MIARLIALALVCLVLAVSAHAAGSGLSPVGYWLTQEGKAVVRIEERGGKLDGHIVWLKEPNFPADDPKGQAGRPKVDRNNPDPAKRNRSTLGLPIVFGFGPPDDEGVCEGGQVYDPESGRTYSGTIRMVGKDRLSLRGYVLVSMIGRTSTWTRVEPSKYGL